MNKPAAMRLIRSRAGLSWLILIAATLTSYVLGLEHGTGALVVVVILGIAAAKVRLVGLDFMELRHAPVQLRVIFESYCVAVWLVLSVLYV